MSIVLSGKYMSVVSKAVMIKCPWVQLKGQKQLVFFCWLECAMEIPTSPELGRESGEGERKVEREINARTAN